MAIFPQPTAFATPVAFGQVTVWSPPRITGIAPDLATFSTTTSNAAHDLLMSPENISTSPASLTTMSFNPSIRVAKWGREPS